ncbi:ACT domain-containing protein [Actinopolyspora halophila]|uniref:ACT domain-containing protein n=1 Tax=Actinopolyspora halophila TaxID=1850 RepID=UPI00037D7BD4|nr:ACT domain-containing protein [Actinopolyspora halophila]
MKNLTLRVHGQRLAVTAPRSEAEPKPGSSAPLTAELNTAGGRTLVLDYEQAARDSGESNHQGPFRVLEVVGPLDFELTGVLASVLNPLAEAEISVFTLATFETDWILVPAGSLAAAVHALRAAGHTVDDHAEGEH